MTDGGRSIRSAAVAGRFYPAGPEELAQDVRRLLDAAQEVELPLPRGLLVPHAGYVCSGIVAAAAFRTLRALGGECYTVYLMGPAHWRPVQGVGLSSADAFATPIGAVPVARDAVQGLLDLPGPYCVSDGAHGPEHCLEVELPFLQATLGDSDADFAIVPMLFGESVEPERVAADLVRLMDDERSLLVVSSDLSHYLPYAQAQAMDRALLDAVAAGDVQAVRQGQACGMLAILTLMTVAERLGWTARVADYRTSGDTCSLRDEVVGYGAVVYG